MGTGLIMGIIIAIIGVVFFFIIKKGKKDRKDEGGVSLHPTAEEMINYTPTPSNLTIFETEFYNLLNEHRLSINVLIVETDTYSRYLCIEHNKYMIERDSLNHDNAFRRNFELERRGVKATDEIVARNYTKAQTFLNGYLNSPSHKAAIENPEFSHVGIKFTKNDKGEYYNTCLFSKF